MLEEQLANIWKEILKIEKIGRNDNFFNLGGHSLLATQLISRIRTNLKSEVPLKAVFENSILKDLAKAIENEYFVKGLLPPIYPTQTKVIPLSFAQQRLWFLEQLLPDLGLYHIPMVLRLFGDLNKEALIKSLNTIVKRHEILRTKIVTIDGVAHQEVLTIDFNLRVEQVEGPEKAKKSEKIDKPSESNEVEKYLSNKIKEETTKPFDFNNETLFRGLLLELLESNTTNNKQKRHNEPNVVNKSKEYILILTFHHIISDGWSNGIFNKELSECYNSYSNNRIPNLEDLPIQYKDYSVWQRGWLQGEVLDKQLSYWKEKLYEVSTLTLPAKPRPKEQSYKGGCYQQCLSKEILNKLNQLAKEKDVTLFMILLAAFKGMLSKVCNQNDIVIGIPIANRRISEIEQLIGFFVNTLVLRTDCSNNPTFEELIKRVEKTSLDAYEHQDVPFEQLVDHLNIPRDLSRQPLFQVMFVLQNIASEELIFGNLKVAHLGAEEAQAKFDLTLNAVETKDGLFLRYDYASDLFDFLCIEKLSNYYIKFLEHILKNPKTYLSEIPILDQTELTKLSKWNDTEHEYPKGKCVHELFEEQVLLNPDRIAVVCGDTKLSYGELNTKANCLAHTIRERYRRIEDKELTGDTLIVLCIERCLEMVIGVLGILKAGGAYVPLNLEYPEDRLKFILSDTKATIVLTRQGLLEKITFLSNNSQGIICLDDKKQLNERTKNLKSINKSSDLVYVMYTSGSTGNPKGSINPTPGISKFIRLDLSNLPIYPNKQTSTGCSCWF